MFDNYPDLMTIDDLCNALQIGKSKAYALCNKGDIKNKRIGRQIRIIKKYLIDYIWDECYDDNTAGECFNGQQLEVLK